VQWCVTHWTRITISRRVIYWHDRLPCCEPLRAKATAGESENSGILLLFRFRRRSCSHAYRICPFRNIVCIKLDAMPCRISDKDRPPLLRCASPCSPVSLRRISRFTNRTFMRLRV